MIMNVYIFKILKEWFRPYNNMIEYIYENNWQKNEKFIKKKFWK